MFEGAHRRFGKWLPRLNFIKEVCLRDGTVGHSFSLLWARHVLSWPSSPRYHLASAIRYSSIQRMFPFCLGQEYFIVSHNFLYMVSSNLLVYSCGGGPCPNASIKSVCKTAYFSATLLLVLVIPSFNDSVTAALISSGEAASYQSLSNSNPFGS